MTAWVVPDFETRSACDLRKAGADRYAEDPSTDIITLRWRDHLGARGGWHPGEPLPPALLHHIEAGHVFVPHNARFERAIWREQMVKLYGAPPIPLRQWADTMARCANLVLPQALDRALKTLDLNVSKDMEGNRLIRSLSRMRKGYFPPLTPEVLARVDQYCDTDVNGQWELHHRLGWLDPDERRVWEMDQRINDRGFALDLDLIRAMQAVVDRATAPLAQEFADITGGLKFTQIAKLKAWCNDQGVWLDKMDKEALERLLGPEELEEDDEDTEERIIEDDTPERIDIPEAVHRALSIRRMVGSASVKKLMAALHCVSADGRVHGSLNYHGAGPGRWSAKLYQPHNLPRGTVKATPDAKIAAIYSGNFQPLKVNPIEAVVSSLRHTIIAERGKILMSQDYSGIEARICLALAGQHDKTALMAAGADVYIDMACQIWPKLARPDWGDKNAINAFKEEHLAERQTGKNSVLGLGFAMGGDKFFDRYCQDQSLDFAHDVVQVYRKEWAPKVPEMWHGLEGAALRAVRTGEAHEAYGVVYKREDRWLTARLPSGRKLWYFNPKVVRRHMPWSTPENPDVRLSWTYQAMKMGRLQTIDAFGGLLTENVVQGLARDLLVNAMFNCEREGLPIVLTVHDEIVVEVDEWEADEVRLEKCLLDVPDWAKRIQVPIAAEGWIGKRYRK